MAEEVKGDIPGQSLKRKDVLYAKRELRKMHPLYNLELEKILPFLDPCVGVSRRCCGNPQPAKGEFDDSKVDTTIILEDGSHPGEYYIDFELDDDEDPMGRLGYGVVSYFGLIYTFLVIFFLLFAGHVPLMYNYASWKAYEGEK